MQPCHARSCRCPGRTSRFLSLRPFLPPDCSVSTESCIRFGTVASRFFAIVVAPKPCCLARSVAREALEFTASQVERLFHGLAPEMAHRHLSQNGLDVDLFADPVRRRCAG